MEASHPEEVPSNLSSRGRTQINLTNWQERTNEKIINSMYGAELENVSGYERATQDPQDLSLLSVCRDSRDEFIKVMKNALPEPGGSIIRYNRRRHY